MASTILVNSIKSQSGTDVNVPTGFKLKVADVGELYIGGVAITTGAQGVISKTATYPIVAADFTGKSSLIVFVDVSAGTSTETIITLPAAADFSTCAIHIVSTATHGSNNKITIKNSTPTEVYTLYHKQDHCEFVSDGTNVFRTGDEWVTVRGEVALTANYSISGNAIVDVFNGSTSSNYSVTSDTSGAWSTTNDDWTAPFAGEFMLQGSCSQEADAYMMGWGLKSGADWILQIHNGDQYGQLQINNKPFLLAKDDVITWWACSTSTASKYLYGNAASTGIRTSANWWCHRRH